MRTWDTPSLIPAYMPSGMEIVEACPTLAVEISNNAIRGQRQEEQTSSGIADKLGGFATRFLRIGQGDASQGFPAFGETADMLSRRIMDQYGMVPNTFYRVLPSSVERALFERVGIYNDLISPLGIPRYQMKPGQTEYQRDAFNEALAATMCSPEDRANFMGRVAEVADFRNDNVIQRLQKDPVEYDFIIKGGGVHAANAACTIQESDPMATILILDDAKDGTQLGGQFVRYGRRPIFDLNSRVKPVWGIQDVYGLPGHGGDLNSMGLHAALRLPDFVGTDRATNVDIGDAAAANMVLSGADVLFVKNAQDGSVDINNVRRIGIPGANFPIITKNPMIQSSGAGYPNRRVESIPGVLTPEDVWTMFGEYESSTVHPGNQFADKVVGLVACGDSAKTTAKLLLGRGPAVAYEGTSIQGMRPRRIIWIAPEIGKLGTKAAWQQGTRSVYSDLAPYFPDGSGGYSLIEPYTGRVSGIFQSSSITTPSKSLTKSPSS